jgi:hypothetical protein
LFSLWRYSGAMEQQESAEALPDPVTQPNPFGARHWRARASGEPEAAPEPASRDLANPYVWVVIAVLGGAAIGILLGLLR